MSDELTEDEQMEIVQSKEFKEALAYRVAESLDNWFVNTPQGSYAFLEMMGYDVETLPDFRGCFGSKAVRIDEIEGNLHLCEQINCPASLGTGECAEDPDFPLRRRV